MEISFDDLSIHFEQLNVVKNVSLEVRSGEFVAIVGPSGCGKSTLLNALAGLLPEGGATINGEILVDGRSLEAWTPLDLNFGYAFQKDNLFPWRTLADNIASGLEVRGVPKPQRAERVRGLIELAGLGGFERFFPHQVSGGMRQRAALMRALAYEPSVLLMDEPFGALDAQMRLTLQAELLRLWQIGKQTILFVTHDLGEAILLAQRVVVLSKRPGRIRAVYDIPIPYPRDPYEIRGTPDFARHEAEIWNLLRDEFRDAPAVAR